MNRQNIDWAEFQDWRWFDIVDDTFLAIFERYGQDWRVVHSSDNSSFTPATIEIGLAYIK